MTMWELIKDEAQTSHSEQLPRSSRRHRLPVQRIHRMLVMGQESLACAPGKLMQLGTTPSHSHVVLPHAPEAFKRMEMRAAMGWEHQSRYNTCPALCRKAVSRFF